MGERQRQELPIISSVRGHFGGFPTELRVRWLQLRGLRPAAFLGPAGPRRRIASGEPAAPLATRDPHCGGASAMSKAQRSLSATVRNRGASPSLRAGDGAYPHPLSLGIGRQGSALA
ncbi:hypothetical protein PHYPSEUDO_010964 [Phytophthora pseudosyringae]|uniref:Uncharacterized protein n=1 Tax=Phytophthora pseudosyringae TaxID=221518 RepID=A0A8T1W5E7_9STRA|nr:hypothetical protein PHYPSEUDO_010964 [Phytophthora pseudosyringae]